jgi:hypothetical protein
MQFHRSRSFVRGSIATPALLVLLAGCGGGKGGGGGGGTAPDVNTPVISNLTGSVSGQGCTLSGAPARVETLTFSYVDADGDLRGGTVVNTTTAPGQAPLVFTVSLPSNGVTITGTTSGQITLTACLAFGSAPNVEEKVRVTDSAGRTSNELTVTVGRPAGAPLLPRGSMPEDALDKALGR